MRIRLTQATLFLWLSTSLPFCSTLYAISESIEIDRDFASASSGQVNLGSVELFELLPATNRDSGIASLRTSFSDRNFVGNTPFLDSFELPESIYKNVVMTWKTPVDADDDAELIRFEVEWNCPRGREGAAVVDGEFITTGILVEAGPVRLVDTDTSAQTWESELRLRLPLEALSRSGFLEGCLSINPIYR